jgi:hypothetical protein
MSIRGFVNRWPILGFVPAIALSFVGCSGTPTIPGPVSAGSATRPSQRATAGNANGNTPSQLSHIGWSCLNVPGHGVHCLDPHFDHERASNTHYQVKVFDTADPSSDDATFLGTESLLRSDQYHGQPCLPGHGEYFAIPLGPSVYYGCHHFDF